MFTPDQIKALQGLSSAFKANPHGTGGLFSGGPEAEMPVSIEKPSDIAGAFAPRPSNFQDSIVEVFTNITAATGTNPDDNCGTPPVAGDLEVARQTLPFGLFYMATQTINITNGNLRRDRTDLPRIIENDVFGPMGNPFVPTPPNGQIDPNTLVGNRFMTFGQNAANAFSYVHIQGDTSKAPAATRLGFIDEYAGLDAQIATGKTDSVSGAAAPGLDSVVNTTGTTLGANTVEDIVDAIRTLRIRADEVMLPGTRFELVVHPQQETELYDVWACNFVTVKCNNTAGDLDLMTIENRRNEMMNGRYVMVDGIQVPVRKSWGVANGFNASAGTNTSDIYILPINNTMTTFNRFEFQPMGTGEMVGLNMDNMFDVRPVNGGFYLMGVIKNDPYCLQYTFTGRHRLVLRYPFLCGRVDNVTYTPQSLRGPEFDGGSVTART
jgi:hypothetical protein